MRLNGGYHKRMERLEAQAPKPALNIPEWTAEQELLGEFRSRLLRFVAPCRVEMKATLPAEFQENVLWWRDAINEALEERPGIWILLAEDELEQVANMFASGVKVFPGYHPQRGDVWERWTIHPLDSSFWWLARDFKIAVENWTPQAGAELPTVITPELLRDIFELWRSEIETV